MINDDNTNKNAKDGCFWGTDSALWLSEFALGAWYGVECVVFSVRAGESGTERGDRLGHNGGEKGRKEQVQRPQW